MIGADDILVHYILKSEYAQFQPSRIFSGLIGVIPKKQHADHPPIPPTQKRPNSVSGPL